MIVPTNIIYRTLHIKFNNATGTCFVFDYDKKQYYVTARHVIEGIKDGQEIELNYKKNWNKHKIKLVGHSSHSDISVFALPTGIVQGESLAASSNDILYSQEIFFLGYPYGLQSDIEHLNDDFPIPFVKKGILSNFLLETPKKILLLDGLNNPGFSGGPIVYIDMKTNKFQICGIVSGYRYEIQNATKNYQDLDIQIKTNTGIIIGYSIEAAIELIKANPIGVSV